MSERTNDLTRDSDTKTFHTRYDSDQQPTEAIVNALASIEGVEPTALEPLYESIDPDSIDTLFDGSGDQEPGELVLECTISGYDVVIRNDGSITIVETVSKQ